MTAAARVRLCVPASLEAAVAGALRRAGGEAITTSPVDSATVVVFAPAGPARRREGQSLRDALAAAAAAVAGVDRAVIVSSAAIYGASPYAPGFVDESWEAPPTHPSRIGEWWRAFERELARIVPAGGLTILRPAPLLDGGSYVSRLLRAPAAVTLSGHDPSIQLLSVGDLASAIACALASPARGIYNVAPAGVIPLRAALRMASRVRVPVPRLLQRAARAPLAAAGAAWPIDQVDFIRYNATISGDRIARQLGFVPARSSAGALSEFLTTPGDPCIAFDPFGQDTRYINAYGRTLFTFLCDYYWRIECAGIESLPAAGRAVLAGPHRGFMPFDGVMLLHLAVRGRGRYIRFLIHPSLVKFPFLFNFMTKLGGIPACRKNADWVLQEDEILGLFPEGIHGAFTPYRDAYRLGKFGRDEFVRAALRNRAPILPFATVGNAEIFPILAKIHWPWWERLTDWPYFPITPTFPLAPVPLPSKWHIRFLPPIHVEAAYPPEAADDPRVVRQISAEVRAVIQAALDEMLARRRWIFFGSIFNQGRHGTV